jgi:hypothetical protein
MNFVGLTFKLVRMQQRFLDRAAADHLHPVMKRFFMRAGGAIRITARRMLKKAGKQRVSGMNYVERGYYEAALARHKRGKGPKPELPQKTALPGKPPLLHSTWDSGTSPLKNRIWFSLRDSNKNEMVVGPAAIGRNRSNLRQGGITTLNELERRHPFMEPAFLAIQPRFADYLQQAAR